MFCKTATFPLWN